MRYRQLQISLFHLPFAEIWCILNVASLPMPGGLDYIKPGAGQRGLVVIA
jgi:hypothetical protein